MTYKAKLLFPETLKEFADQVGCKWLLMFESEPIATGHTGILHFSAKVVNSGFKWVELETRFSGFHVRMNLEHDDTPCKLWGFVAFDEEGNIFDATADWRRTKKPSSF